MAAFDRRPSLVLSAANTQYDKGQSSFETDSDNNLNLGVALFEMAYYCLFMGWA